MADYRPVSDLRNKFPEIEASVRKGNPVFLTKNGNSSMVVLSLEAYSQLVAPVEAALDEAESYAASHSERMTEEEVFSGVRREISEL